MIYGLERWERYEFEYDDSICGFGCVAALFWLYIRAISQTRRNSEGQYEFDNALIIRNVTHECHSVDDLYL